MRFMPPSPRRLTVTWVVLMVLTAASMAGGRAGSDGTESLGTAWVALVLAVTGVKAMGVLLEYLNLRASTGGWIGTFSAFVAAICLVILAAYAIAA